MRDARYRKTYEVTGWAYDGAAYCTDHKPDTKAPNPITLGDEWNYTPTCDVCHAAIDVTVLR